MKKLGIYTLSASVALAYLMSVVGVGVHTCQHSGKRQVVLLAPGNCTCGHEHEKAASCAVEDESYCGNENRCCSEDERCCEVAYQVLKVDQEVHNAKSLLKNVTEYFTWLFTPAMALELSHGAPATALNHRPPPLTANTLPDIHRLSQLRL